MINFMVFLFLDLEFEDEPEFQIEEELADGEEIDQDILLEGEEECDNDANDEGDDEDIDEEDVVEEEEKTDDGEVKELEACLEVIKLDDAEDDNVQTDANDDSNAKQDEVPVHVYWAIIWYIVCVYCMESKADVVPMERIIVEACFGWRNVH